MECESMFASNVTFYDLPENCLWLIFEHLTLPQKVGSLRVSKQWRQVISEVIKFLETDLNFGLYHAKRPNGSYGPLDIRTFKSGDLAFFDIYKLQNVETVSIRANSRADLTLRSQDISTLFERFPNLKSLTLGFIRVEPFPEDFKFETIQQLSLIRCRSLEVNWNQFLERFHSLRSLEFKADCVHQVTIATFQELKHLAKLSLGTVHFTNLAEIIRHLYENIKEISVDSFITDIAANDNYLVFQLFQSCPKLESLNLSFASFRFRHFPASNDEAEKAFQSLKKLKLSRFRMTPAAFGGILKTMPKLQTLQLAAFEVLCELSEKSDVQSGDVCCNNCTIEFARQLSISTLEKLSVRLNDRVDSVSYGVVLNDLLNQNRLPLLRSLHWLCANHFFETLFASFFKRASENPKELFELSLCTFAPNYDMEQLICKLGMPRNMRFRKPPRYQT